MRAMLIGLLFLTGCATAPHQMVTDLDASTDKYKSAECAQARKIALEYDANVPSRVGVGLGLGLLLGPFGLPFAIWADMSQDSKREAVVTEVRRNCT